jgi:hypothetical protein
VINLIRLVPVATLLISMLFLSSPAAAATCIVPTLTHPTIQSAVNDPTCDPIEVLPGVYNEDVTINRSVTLNGAQDGQPVATRVFAAPNESTVNGLVTVNAPNVTFDGFSLTNSGPNDNNGILIKTAGSGALITNDIISVVGTLTLTSNAQGIYLENGPDNVRVIANRISDIVSIPSAKGVYVGDTAATNPSANTLISENEITDITSTRGAYAIQVNNRQGQPGLRIEDNTIRTLNGGWVHAIGLEGDTPNVVVRLNSITNLVAGNVNDNIAVFFETNPSFPTAQVNLNNFNLTIAHFGIAVHPALWSAPGGDVDGTCNWWGAPNGPGPVGTGAGARVTIRVDFAPWLNAPVPFGACIGGLESTPGKVTGGGQVGGEDPLFSLTGDLLSLPALVVSASGPNENATFGFTVKCCPETGNLQYNDHGAGVRIKALSIIGLFISEPGMSCPAVPGSKHAVFTGTAEVSGPLGTDEEDFTVQVDDCGEPGTMDTFGIDTETYHNPPSQLIGGNIKIH